ncbi:hypothetical protein WAJ21_21730, partial [Acinetobacter baumannii]
SGYTADYDYIMGQLAYAAGITKKKALLVLTSYPTNPSNAAGWAAAVAGHGIIAKALHDSGWDAIFHDNEPYQDRFGNPLPGP